MFHLVLERAPARRAAGGFERKRGCGRDRTSHIYPFTHKWKINMTLLVSPLAWGKINTINNFTYSTNDSLILLYSILLFIIFLTVILDSDWSVWHLMYQDFPHPRFEFVTNKWLEYLKSIFCVQWLSPHSFALRKHRVSIKQMIKLRWCQIKVKKYVNNQTFWGRDLDAFGLFADWSRLSYPPGHVVEHRVIRPPKSAIAFKSM